MEKARHDFIMETLANYSALKYIGRLSPDAVNFPKNLPKTNGKEDVEVHLFEFENGTQFFTRWRFTNK